jgi:hypothetical protein
MFKHVLAILALTVAGGVMAADATCMAQVTEKRLAGAAKTSFMKKCETDAKATCEGASKEKKLAGAAKNSFEKKCLKDAVG